KMKNKYINGMNEIKADDELKRKIISSVKHNGHKNRSLFFTLKRTVVSIAAACIFALVITFGVQFIQNDSDMARQKQSRVQSLFHGFVITAYASDGTPFEIKPNVEFSLGKYQMTMSSVPGFPLKIVCNEADTVKLTVTDGRFLLWASPDWQVRNKGKELEIKSGDTVYWTPLKGENTDTIATNCNVVIKAYKSNKELGSNSIKIGSDDDYTYTGILFE
ncbi:MAG: hypothetical protein AB1633_13270, partial [Elusimicrobiota bacterium]